MKATDIIFITHFFPPIGGAGVQRSSKFVKYLPEFDFRPLVLTSQLHKISRWSPKDESLVLDVKNNNSIFRLPEDADTLPKDNTAENPSRTKAIYKLGLQIAKENNPKLIYVSISPFGDLCGAIKLSKELNLPLIADLRDPWALDEFQTYRSFYHKRKAIEAMHSSLVECDSIIMNTPTATDSLKSNFPDFTSKKIFTITNGYDQEDFEHSQSKGELCSDKFNIVHSGTFHTAYAIKQRKRKLLDIALGRRTRGIDVKGRTPYYLFEALKNIQKTAPEKFTKIATTFTGVTAAEDEKLIDSYNLNSTVNSTGYINHQKNIHLLKSANLLFLPMHGLPSNVSASIVPGKTYEYLASNIPILAAVPSGDTKTFIEDSNSGYTCNPSDVSRIEKIIIQEFDKWQEGHPSHNGNLNYIQRFERKELTKKLADAFSETISA
ncbi:glycosyltransferase [Puniceicoccaceae bacterium K14]|nr:glycosyltransferase [Puniceicoccaceae bacterium K14]